MIAILEDRKGFRHSIWLDYKKPYLSIRVAPPLLPREIGDLGGPEGLVAETIDFYFERWIEENKVALFRERT